MPPENEVHNVGLNWFELGAFVQNGDGKFVPVIDHILSLLSQAGAITDKLRSMPFAFTTETGKPLD